MSQSSTLANTQQVLLHFRKKFVFNPVIHASTLFSSWGEKALFEEKTSEKRWYAETDTKTHSVRTGNTFIIFDKWRKIQFPGSIRTHFRKGRTKFPLPGFPEVFSGIRHEATDIASVKSLAEDIMRIDFLPLNHVNRYRHPVLESRASWNCTTCFPKL